MIEKNVFEIFQVAVGNTSQRTIVACVAVCVAVCVAEYVAACVAACVTA